MQMTVSGKALSKIGIGTYGIGGRGHRDMPLTEKQEDEKYIDALVYTFSKGSNFTEISQGYGHGNALRLFRCAVDKAAVRREDLFITHSLYPRDLPNIDTIHQDIAEFYMAMETDYADSTLVTQSLIQQYGESVIYDILHELLENNKSRFVSLSNASPSWIRKFHIEFGDKFFAHEGHLSFEVRALQDKGVFSTCDALGVTNIIWRPLRRNMTLNHQWPLLDELAAKYDKTQSQIALNWLCELNYLPMVFSTNQEHIQENMASTEFTMTAEDYQRLTDFRPSVKGLPELNWEAPSIDDEIVTQVMEFEKYLA